MNPETGTTLSCRHTLTERIATGGMGEARHTASLHHSLDTTSTSTTPSPATANTVVSPSVTSSVPNEPNPGKGNGKKKGN